LAEIKRSFFFNEKVEKEFIIRITTSSETYILLFFYPFCPLKELFAKLMYYLD